MMRRLVIVGAGAALVGAAITGGVAQASGGKDASASIGTHATGVAEVVRTNLISTVQLGGSLGYDGSYSIFAPSGPTPEQVSQAEQTVVKDQQMLTTDQSAERTDQAANVQQLSSDRSALDAAQSTLNSDANQKSQDCPGGGTATPTCTQDTQKVSQDQTQVNQAQQAMATSEANAARSAIQDQAKVTSDETLMADDQANLVNLEDREVGPATTYTSLPAAGQVVTQNQPVYSLDGQPVPLFYGSTPMYRAFRLGMGDGSDVAELTQDLISLGFGSGLTSSSHYSSATAAAVSAWQRSLGLPATGVVLLGQLVFEPGPIRVTAVTPSAGQTVNPGSVLTATSTNRVVTIALSVTQEYLVHTGDAVSVILPDGKTTVAGRVQQISTVATTDNNGNNGNSGGGNGGNSAPTVNVTIKLDSTAATGNLDQAPVNVNITTQHADNVLAVPINALLALTGGGDAVEVVNGSDRHLVAVQTGLFSDTMVEVSGDGITEGTQVEVPTS